MIIRNVPFEDVFADESGGNIKTPQSEYQSNGRFPVVDQGKPLIAGYIDDEERLCGDGRPAIVFGDHTRCVKYVGFPFCMGADGVKVLRPKIEADLKYLYYYLKQVKLPDAGYDRHYKYLKRTEVVLPSLPEQTRIAAILDQADALRVMRREALAQLDSLTQAIFIEMFGDPTPTRSNWPISKLGKVCVKISDGTHHSPTIQPSGVPYITAKHLKEYGLDFDLAPWFISPADHRSIYSRCDPKLGDVLYIKDGATTGIAAVNHYDFEFSMLSSLALLRPDSEVLNAYYLCQWLNNSAVKNEILGAMSGAAIRRLTLAKIKAISIPLPAIGLQRQFAARLTSIHLLKKAQNQSLAQLDALFASLQFRAFRGEL